MLKFFQCHLCGVWTISSEENSPRLGLEFGVGLVLELGLGSNFPRGLLS